MKKYLPYIIGGIAILALGLVVLLAKKRPPRMDERITLRQRDKIPYGFYAAKNLLPSLFPQARITTDDEGPGEWKGIDVNAAGQAIFLVSHDFSASHNEVDALVAFVQKGNYVFIISPSLSEEAEYFFSLRMSEKTGFSVLSNDSLEVELSAPRFASAKYAYPGKAYENHFEKWKEDNVIILGRNAKGKPNFLQLNSMDGSLFLHSSPLVFSNYFLLHKDNIRYYQQTLSVIPSSITKVVWNEYYMVNRNRQSKDPNWLSVLFRFPAFKSALLTAMAFILLYLFSEMRRRQRYIPQLEKPKNESLDFVQTIGRLYYDKRDHHDLAKKMTGYFLDHVRQQYKLPTEILDADFVTALHAKSGYPVVELNEIVGFIQWIRDSSDISSEQLSHFYQQLETFYQTT